MTWYLVKSRGKTISKHKTYLTAIRKRSKVNKTKGHKGFGKSYVIKREKLLARDK